MPLLRRRTLTLYVPTPWGLMLLMLAFAATFAALRWSVYPFLAPVRPLPDAIVVMEGWLPDYAVDAVVNAYRADTNRLVISTGCDLEIGSPLLPHRNYATLGAARLEARGVPAGHIRTVPAEQAVRTDRTYSCGVRTARFLREEGLSGRPVTVYSLGPHGRRSHYLFRLALGRDYPVGIVSVRPADYDPAHWWNCSAGFRRVTDEAIAWVYARFLFWPTNPAA